MKNLVDLCCVIRSKNSGPREITFDLIAKSPRDFAVLQRGADAVRKFMLKNKPAALGQLVSFDLHLSALAIKATYRRKHRSGSILDTDVYGGQFGGFLYGLRLRSDKK